MTKGQRIALQADWWPAACRAQGWPVADRKVRLRVCAWAVSLKNPSQLELLNAIKSDRTPPRWLESTNDLDNKADIDAVKACLLMLADNVEQTKEVGRPEFGSARRKRNEIRAHLKCLALFEPHPRAFVAHLIRDMFAAKLGMDVTILELADDDSESPFNARHPSDLDRLLMRLAKIVNDKRNLNALAPDWQHMQGTEPLTIHEMKLTAGVRCDCAICRGLKTPILPPLPAEENWADFDPELETVTDEFGGDAGEGGDNPF